MSHSARLNSGHRGTIRLAKATFNLSVNATGTVTPVWQWSYFNTDLACLLFKVLLHNKESTENVEQGEKGELKKKSSVKH